MFARILYLLSLREFPLSLVFTGTTLWLIERYFFFPLSRAGLLYDVAITWAMCCSAAALFSRNPWLKRLSKAAFNLFAIAASVVSGYLIYLIALTFFPHVELVWVYTLRMVPMVALVLGLMRERRLYSAASP
jgi:hypothetical protein